MTLMTLSNTLDPVRLEGRPESWPDPLEPRPRAEADDVANVLDHYFSGRTHYLSHVARNGIEEHALPKFEDADISLVRGLGRRMYRRGCYLNSTTVEVVKRLKAYAAGDFEFFARMCVELAQGAAENHQAIGRVTVCVALAKLMESALDSGDPEQQTLLATSPALHRLIEVGIAGRMVRDVLRYHLVGLRDAIHGDTLSAVAHIAIAASRTEPWQLFGRSPEAAEHHLLRWATKLLGRDMAARGVQEVCDGNSDCEQHDAGSAPTECYLVLDDYCRILDLAIRMVPDFIVERTARDLFFGLSDLFLHFLSRTQRGASNPDIRLSVDEMCDGFRGWARPPATPDYRVWLTALGKRGILAEVTDHEVPNVPRRYRLTHTFEAGEPVACHEDGFIAAVEALEM
jgi:hypothetical protein